MLSLFSLKLFRKVSEIHMTALVETSGNENIPCQNDKGALVKILAGDQPKATHIHSCSNCTSVVYYTEIVCWFIVSAKKTFRQVFPFISTTVGCWRPHKSNIWFWEWLGVWVRMRNEFLSCILRPTLSTSTWYAVILMEIEMETKSKHLQLEQQ